MLQCHEEWVWPWVWHHCKCSTRWEEQLWLNWLSWMQVIGPVRIWSVYKSKHFLLHWTYLGDNFVNDSSVLYYLLMIPKGRVERSEKSFGKELKSVVKASDMVLLFERVVQLTERCHLLVICSCIVGIDSKNLFGDAKPLKHLLKGLCHGNASVGLQKGLACTNRYLNVNWHTSGSSMTSRRNMSICKGS